MATSTELSEDEFHRMQLQLIELRTKNYQLTDDCTKQQRVINEYTQQIEALTKDIQKANKAVSKSKKAKEVEEILSENERLHKKLESQEEEFRLQNQTLMQELGQVISENENLVKEITSLKDNQDNIKPSAVTIEVEDELRHFQAQNSALQKSISHQKETSQAEIAELKQTIQDLEEQCRKLAGQRSGPIGSSERTVEGQADPEEAVDETAVSARNKDDILKEGCGDASNLDSVTHSSKEKQADNNLDELVLNLETEREEKKLLKSQLFDKEEKYTKEMKKLRDDFDKITEKFKKKQDSYVHLQEEKENMFSDLSSKLESMTKGRENDVETLNSQVRHLKQQLADTNQGIEDYKAKAGKRIRELEHETANLQSKLDANSVENQEELQEQTRQLQSEVSTLKAQISEKLTAIQDLQLKLKECENTLQSTRNQLSMCEQEREQQLQVNQESNKLAEKRKALVDELAIKYQKESDDHRSVMKLTEERHSQQVVKLEEEISQLKTNVKSFDKVKSECEDLKSKLASAEEAKGWLERQLKQTEEHLSEREAELQGDLDSSTVQHGEEIDRLKDEHVAALKERDQELEKQKVINDEYEETVNNLRQKIKDGQDEKKIHEKKGATLLKDLKRQLIAERKRADKLQERLQELLSDSNSRRSVEELFSQRDGSEQKWEISSISSWSTSGVGISRDNTTGSLSPSGKSDGRADSPPTSLVQENNDLLSRIAEMQESRWSLEERVRHLESSNSAMAEDLLNKTAIIEHYIMDTGSKSAEVTSPTQDKLTLKRVVDFVKDKGDQNLREINQKMQRMLEETLIKNMHLQQNLETLTNELMAAKND